MGSVTRYHLVCRNFEITMMKYRSLIPLVVSATLLHACSGGNDNQPAADQQPAPEQQQPAEVQQPAATDAAPRVFIASPADGDIVSSPVTVKFGIENFGLAPAGTAEANTGHHHLLVDTDLPPLDQPIPADDNHLHFGKAQTETMLELAPGEHTLQLLLGDGNHVPHDTALISEPITITVKQSSAPAEALE
jgi:hypothetical protein